VDKNQTWTVATTPTSRALTRRGFIVVAQYLPSGQNAATRGDHRRMKLIGKMKSLFATGARVAQQGLCLIVSGSILWSTEVAAQGAPPSCPSNLATFVNTARQHFGTYGIATP